MKKKIKEYCQIKAYQNIKLWYVLMMAVNSYQVFDIILTIIDAITSTQEEDKYLFIYRILTQIVILVIFHTVMSKLQKLRSRYLNLANVLKFICVKVSFFETNYAIIFHRDPYLVGSSVESLSLLIAFLISTESKICQSCVIFASLTHMLIRENHYSSNNEIMGAIRLVLIHLTIQMTLLVYYFKENFLLDRSNSQLIQMGVLSRNANYSPIISTRQNQRNVPQIYEENRDAQQIQNEIDTESEPTQLEQFYESVLNSIECGIYTFENFLDPVKTINPFMSHIILKEDHLNEQFLSSQLIDYGQLADQNIIIQPQFNRSKDIVLFLKFIQTLDAQQIEFDSASNPLKEIQLFLRNTTLKTIMDHFNAFLHIKHQSTHELLDFSLKMYLKKDNLYSSINLCPVLLKKKPQLLIFAIDLTESPLLCGIMSSMKNSDTMMSDISQKIKQPLNCTISMLEITMKSVPVNIQEQYLTPALAGCKLLISHANDILDYITLRNKGQIELQQLDIHVKDFLLDAITLVKSQALFRGLNIQLHIRNQVPQFIRTDPNRLRQILSNLLTTIIHATIKGKVEVIATKSSDFQDHVELILRVHASETNFSVLKTIDKTVRYFKQFTLKSGQVIDLATAGKQFSQSIIIAFYLSLNLSAIPFEYNYERVGDKEMLNFVIQVKNTNPNFHLSLSSRRQSAMIRNQMSLKQLFGQQSQIKRHQSSTAKLSIIQKLIPSNTTQFLQAVPDQVPQSLQQMPQIIVQQQAQTSQRSESSGVIIAEELEIPSPKFQDKDKGSKMESVSEQSEHDSPSSYNSEDDVENQIDKVINKKPQFMDYVNEEKSNHQMMAFLGSRDSVMTFGNRSSMYSSIRFSTTTMQPNDLIDCFEKMEKIKKQKFTQNCDCSRIIIQENNDYDLYALSHQLENIGITYEYTLQRDGIMERLTAQFVADKTCCKGFTLILIALEENDEDIIRLCNNIKELNLQYKKDVRIIGLVGFHNDDNRNLIRKLPLHDFLSKPIMIDALLFILAKWVKL